MAAMGQAAAGDPPVPDAAWPVGAVVLAAGASTRMGAPKALLPWHGRPLAAQVVGELLATPIAHVVVVTGHGADAIRAVLPASARVSVVDNARWSEGKAGSVVRGVAALPAGLHVLVAAIDQPRPASLVRALVGAHLGGLDDGRVASIAGHGGRRGHPVILVPSLRDELLALDEATAGLRAVVARHGAAVVTVDVGDPAALVNLNTPAEFAAAARAEPGAT